MFPDIYNEDWFAMASEASSGGVVHAGDVWQLKFNPFDDPVRAVQQEFGDLIAEGLYESFSQGNETRSTTLSYWDTFRAKRAEYIEGIRGRLERREDSNEFVQAGKVLEKALEQLALITSQDCLDLLAAWQEDRHDFAVNSTRLSGVHSYTSAFETLALPRWQEVAFGESERLDALELGRPQSLSRSRSSMAPVA
jgi:hypothetical protein